MDGPARHGRGTVLEQSLPVSSGKRGGDQPVERKRTGPLPPWFETESKVLTQKNEGERDRSQGGSKQEGILSSKRKKKTETVFSARVKPTDAQNG